MDEILGRFPGLGKEIFDQLDDQDLAKSRRVSKTWKNSIDREKNVWLRTIKKQFGDFKSQDWQKVLFKIPTNKAKDLALGITQFYKSEPARFDENWSPLHITVEQGNFNLSQFVLRKVDVKNPKNKKGCTPLQLAAEKGNFDLCRIIFASAEETRLKGL